jgi:hypothetical protein
MHSPDEEFQTLTVPSYDPETMVSTSTHAMSTT